MKLQLFSTFFALSFLLVGCMISNPNNQSDFFKNFDADDFFQETLASIPGTNIVSAGGGQTGSGGSGPFISHKDFRVVFQASSLENSQKCFPTIQTALMNVLKSNGITPQVRVNGTDQYSLAYDSGRSVGWIDVWFLNHGSDQYQMLLIINEF